MSNLFKSKFLLGMMVAAFALVGAATVSAADCSLGTATLKQGSKGTAVKCLQMMLNDNNYTVSESGAGSPGLETSTFGSKTKMAVMGFQASNDLTSNGIFDAASRAALLALGSGSSSTGATCPNGNLLSNNCMPASNTGTGATCPNGNLLSNNCLPATNTVVSTGEGSVTVSYDAVPANNLAINRGESKVLMNIKVKATGSDMKVSRVWLDINKRIWLSADTATLLDGDTVLATLPLSASTVTEVTAGSAYQLQFNGFNVTVPVGTTKILSVKFNRPTLTSNNDSVTVAATSTLRAVDMAGITATYTLGARTLNFADTAAATGTLTNTLSATSPAAGSVSGLSTTAGSLTAIKLMDFDLKATDGTVNVSDIAGTIATGTGTCTVAQCVASIELRDGATVIDSVTGASTFTFSNESIDVVPGSTKTLSIWAKVNHIASSYVVAGDSLTATITNVTGTSGPAFAAANATPDVPGSAQYLYQYAPTFALVNTSTYPTSATQIDESNSTTVTKAGNYKLSFSVTAPAGSDIYVDMPSTIQVQNYAASPSIAGTSKAESTVYGGTLTTSYEVSGSSSVGAVATTYDKVIAGQTRYFTISGYIPKGTASGDTGIRVAAVKWTATDSLTTGVQTQTWGISDLKTGKVRVTLN